MIIKESSKILNKNNSFGFTLVELAIVMIIVGLLIGGILKGQELAANARVNRTLQDIKAYQAAAHTFKDAYKFLPGDLSNADDVIPNCTGSCAAAGGNQNGFIGTANIANWSRDDQSGLGTEPTQFWIHLGLTNLINGVNTQNIQTWGYAYPAAPIGGGFQVFHARETGTNQAYGHYFLLRLNPTGDPHPTTAGQAVLSPIMLSRMDTKIDDGVPNLGSVISDDAGNACWNTATTRYVPSTSRICLAAFKFY